jgi:hypothetical protein
MSAYDRFRTPISHAPKTHNSRTTNHQDIENIVYMKFEASPPGLTVREWVTLPLVASREPPWSHVTRGILAYRRWLARQVHPEAALVTLMVEACVAAHEAGRPFCQHGSLGVSNIHARRHELPDPLCHLTRRRLYALVKTAVKQGRLVRGKTGTRGPLRAP